MRHHNRLDKAVDAIRAVFPNASIELFSDDPYSYGCANMLRITDGDDCTQYPIRQGEPVVKAAHGAVMALVDYKFRRGAV